MNMAQHLWERSEESPGRIGIIYEDGRTWTWSQWADESARFARALRECGVEQGDRVGLFLQNSPELVFLLFATWQLGAVPVTISSLYGSNELEECLKKTSPNLVVTIPARLHAVPGQYRSASVGPSETDAPDLAAMASSAAPVEGLVEVDPNSEGVILFTGGSTGLPKPVISTPGGVFQAMATLAMASKSGKPGPYPLAPIEASPNLLCWPLFHGGGQHSLMFAVFVGRSVVLMERFKIDRLSELVNRYRIDNLFLLPTMMYDLVRYQGDVDLSSVRQILTAGQTLEPSLRAEFEERFHVPILSNYGSTETGHVAGWSSKDLREGRWRPGAAGRIYDGVDVEVRGEDMQRVELGQEGEIWVRTDMSKGYAGDVTDSEILIVGGWIRTGDVGRIDGDKVLYLAGRKRDLIKTGGYQVWPGELERELREHPAVADVIVVGVPDERFGEIPKALVVLRDGTTADESEIIAFSRERLAHFKQIRAVAFVEELPRSDAGKVQRHDIQSKS